MARSGRCARVVTLGAALLAGGCPPLRAQSESFDKPITLYVAGTAGGGIDLAARALGRYMGRYIPGKPSVVVQDMPGAGGIRAANFLAESAPRDGTAIATFAGGPLIEPLIGARDPGYDMSKFTWIGAMSKDVGLCLAYGTTPFKTIDDVRKQEMILAGTGAGSSTDTEPVVLNAVLHTRFRVVTGYLGTKETVLAIENGEVHGRCSFPLSALKVTRPDWLRDGKVAVLLQMALERSHELPDVPLVLDLITDPADRQLVELMAASRAIAYPFAAAPGTPPARAQALRRAFDATMRDGAFIAEAKQMGIDIEPTSGEAAQTLMARIYATPQAVVARAKQLLTPK